MAFSSAVNGFGDPVPPFTSRFRDDGDCANASTGLP